MLSETTCISAKSTVLENVKKLVNTLPFFVTSRKASISVSIQFFIIIFSNRNVPQWKGYDKLLYKENAIKCGLSSQTLATHDSS